MGSEYPRLADRRLTSVPVRHFPGIARNHQRKSFSSSSAGGATVKVPKSALTPNTRLKKFQKLRDRNLRKDVLNRNNKRKQLKMLENIEAQPSEAGVPNSPQKLKELAKMENGEKDIENGRKENGLNGIEEETVVVERNGVEEHVQVRKSLRRSRTKEQDVSVEEVEQEPETVLTQEAEVTSGRRSPEVRDLEVDVKIVESPASTSRRRSTPRRASPDASSVSSDRRGESSSYDLNWTSGNLRISGRRGIREMSPPRKRKSDGLDEEPASKRVAYTPSIPSPGWRFLSPFSLFKRTPRTVSNRPVDDSLFVNVSTDSDVDVDLDTSGVTELSPQENTESDDVTQERPTPEPPSKSWLCRLM